MAKKLTGVARMIKSKHDLIARLKSEIGEVEKRNRFEIRMIRKRIRIARTILSALQKGSLKV
jgi:hypothetical protein